MRIAFDCQAFVLQSNGGISRYFTRIAQGLMNMEQQVRVFAPLHRNHHLPSLPQESIYGRYTNRYPPKTTRLFLALNQLKSRSRIARWKPDLVHETYYARFGSAPRECPTVITVYDMIHELFQNEIPFTDNTTRNKRIAINRADHVLCISENTKLDLMRLHGTPASKLSVVHLGFDQFVAREGLLAPHTLSSKPFLLYVGNRAGYKNFAGLLKSAAASKRLISDFDIIAFGGEKFSSAELRLIRSLGFAENQVRHKSGDDSLLGNLYSLARAFVYPSIYEGFGIPPLEAMAHHCPVISSNTSSMPEVIGAAGEYFNPIDTDDMSHAIEAVVYSDSRIDELIKLGERQLTAFSWNKCTQETLNVYRSLT
jgi:glycosyltransferase involved in cell wall biosynthesis